MRQGLKLQHRLGMPTLTHYGAGAGWREAGSPDIASAAADHPAASSSRASTRAVLRTGD